MTYRVNGEDLFLLKKQDEPGKPVILWLSDQEDGDLAKSRTFFRMSDGIWGEFTPDLEVGQRPEPVVLVPDGPWSGIASPWTPEEYASALFTDGEVRGWLFDVN